MLLDLLSLLRLRKPLLILYLSTTLSLLSLSFILDGLFEIIFNLFETNILLLAFILLLLLGLLFIFHLLLDDQAAFGLVPVCEDVFVLLAGLRVGLFLDYALHEIIKILRCNCLGIALVIFIDLNGERIIDIINLLHPTLRVRSILVLPLLFNPHSFFFSPHNNSPFLFLLLLLVLLLLLELRGIVIEIILEIGTRLCNAYRMFYRVISYINTIK